ncbi:hypothetical protein RB195_017721 [Necator americanus]|uniref:Mos1 transposase HTH domain-containing protein n=1 Tax=Necator americanus TaxID=51031 RepID=A0ABR1C9M1_NECAM
MPRSFKPSSLHLCNAYIDRRLKEVYKEHASARSTLYKWHSKLATGDYSIEDEDRSGRPMELDLVLLRRQMEANPFQNTRELTVALGMSQTTVVRGMVSIGKVRKLGR